MKILFVYESRIMFVLTHTHIYIYTFDYSSIGNQSIESTNRAYYLRKRQRHTFSLISNTHLRAFAHTHTHTQTQYLAGAITFIRPSNLNERMPTTVKRRLRHNCTAILLYRYFFTHVRFSAVAWLFAKRAMENRKSFNDFSTFSLAFFTFSICYFR